MRDGSFRERMMKFRLSVSKEAEEMKDSYLALQRLSELYQRFSPEDRDRADRVLSEWIVSDDEDVRFDAQSLIRKFTVKSTIPALRRLDEKLATSAEVSAPFEREVVVDLIAELTGAPAE